MRKEDLIECFNDTLKLASEGRLRHRTIKAQKSSKVYKEGFIAKKYKKRNTKADIIVEMNTSFASATKYLEYGRAAVLNFANPVQPGGGVRIGAMAQEECLCRSSNLFACLSSKAVKEEFYDYHMNNGSNMNSDRIIYSRDVIVFKSDDYIPILLDKKEWFCVDVITCAAPYLGEIDWIDGNELKNMVKSRIRNIFESAVENKVSVMILGAFGCGAFYNPPELVAEAFHEVIIEGHYRDYFNKIVFAIKADDNRGMLNYETFNRELGNYEALKKFEGKSFSIFGDSISTLEGYNPDGCAVFYYKAVAESAGIKGQADTWWGMVIDSLGGKLLVNNSWSGCRVTPSVQDDAAGSAGCCMERTQNLHDKSGTPDYIIIYMGFNDWGSGVHVGSISFEKNIEDNTEFADAYALMLHRIKENYPSAVIYCCTLCKTYMEEDSSFSFPESFGGVHIDEYNSAIREDALYQNCRLLDLASYNIPYDTMDGTHPTQKGMNTLAELVVRGILHERG